ncbi:hypothetical protein VSS74_04155 [Conexibacter stalactiti]|uniref:Protein activator of alkane oxidation PraB n=1 Tax=Conexibacter stalactiti TaxID=1940611 RepID=A0ABU4HJN6_9ACTN|nr:hypothetical protein [Conexibacter stalactiti]MDW5593516.1 hypothetical protein [Conexibacter stalactiti]MEC5034157.1 hypothetical protein [Conexibacter stalactiti]
MRKSFLLGLVAMFALAFGASTASAFPISASPGGAITATGARFTVEGPLGVNVICNVTMTGTLATSAARSGASIGTISGVSLSGCNYTTTVLIGSGWGIRVNSHDTPLTSVLNTINNVAFEVQGLPLAGTCLFTGSINFLIGVSGGLSQGIRTLASTLTSGCPLITGRVVADQAFTLSPQQRLTI